MRESFQDSATMATAVATAVVRLAATDVAVEVTTASMPPMSLVMRDWTSPLRVRVKKATDCRCRWPKTLVRRPCMTCWPTLVLIQVWITPNAEVTAAMPIIAAAPAGAGVLGVLRILGVRVWGRQVLALFCGGRARAGQAVDQVRGEVSRLLRLA